MLTSSPLRNPPLVLLSARGSIGDIFPIMHFSILCQIEFIFSLTEKNILTGELNTDKIDLALGIDHFDENKN